MSHTYHIRQCTNDLCRFRYPAASDDLRARHCLRCGSETILAATLSLADERATAAQPTAQPARRVEVLLDNIRSVYNVGSIFRTSDGAGIAHLHLCGITPTPDHPKLAKTALGAEESLGWSYQTNAVDLAAQLKEHGYHIWALEETVGALPIFTSPQVDKETPILLVVGNELTGVDPGVLDLCHASLYIPMRGVKRSLNVATAFGVAAYAVVGQ